MLKFVFSQHVMQYLLATKIGTCTNITGTITRYIATKRYSDEYQAIDIYDKLVEVAEDITSTKSSGSKDLIQPLIPINKTQQEVNISALFGSTCPLCGDEMQLRKGMYGNFYSCINYPACDATRDKHGNISSKTILKMKAALDTKVQEQQNELYIDELIDIEY